MYENLVLLYDLQQIDTTLDALKREFSALDPGREEKTVYDEAASAFKEADHTLKATTAAIKDAELEQQTLDAKQKTVETKMNSGKVTNYKELTAMTEEVEMFNRQRKTLDDKLLGLMDGLEYIRKTAAQRKAELKTAAAALKAKQEGYKDRAETMQAQYRLLNKQRNAAAVPVPEALMKRYDTMRANKQGIAIVRIEDGNACGGCKMGLPSALVSMIREKKSQQTCDNCGRIIIMKEG